MTIIHQDAPKMRPNLDALHDQGYQVDITHTPDGFTIAAHGPRDLAVSAPTLAQALATTATQAIAPAPALRRLADALDELPQAELSPPDIVRALHSIPAGPERQSAFNVLARTLRHAPGYRGWLWHWTVARPRVDVVALIRAAADQAETVTR
ncbi:hypothetical protein [Microbispora sp. CA-102843]|uniref:hypothetical protein n=1 Tax=Microbispora sp. CA-102843 TaxID=3239952 RepID=UPI003D935B97